MKRRTIVKTHLIATWIAVWIISCFFSFSLIAEILGYQEFIKQVKTGIFYCLPILLIVMPLLRITGRKLSVNHKSSIIKIKLKRMRFIVLNGIILISLAIYLYFRAIDNKIDNTFLSIQIIELIFGALNLTLIGLNIKSGMELSGKKKSK